MGVCMWDGRGASSSSSSSHTATARHGQLTVLHSTVRALDSQEASFLLLPQILLLSSPLLSSPPLPLPSFLLAPSRGFPSLSLPLLFSLFAEAPLRRASQVSTSTSTYVCMYLPTYDLASEAAVRFPFLSSRPLSLNKSSSLLDGMEMSEH